MKLFYKNLFNAFGRNTTSLQINTLQQLYSFILVTTHIKRKYFNKLSWNLDATYFKYLYIYLSLFLFYFLFTLSSNS